MTLNLSWLQSLETRVNTIVWGCVVHQYTQFIWNPLLRAETQTPPWCGQWCRYCLNLATSKPTSVKFSGSGVMDPFYLLQECGAIPWDVQAFAERLEVSPAQHSSRLKCVATGLDWSHLLLNNIKTLDLHKSCCDTSFICCWTALKHWIFTRVAVIQASLALEYISNDDFRHLQLMGLFHISVKYT